MKRLNLAFLALALAIISLASNANGALLLRNGSFDDDPDLGGGDETTMAPTGWFTHYTIDQSWSDFRFGNDGNGGWDNNGITFGQNYLGPNFDPGPEDGYYYTSLGHYNGELGIRLNGFGYNRSGRPNPAGGFDVSFYYSSGSSFVGADGSDVAAGTELLASTFVDISALTGNTGRSQGFSLSFDFSTSVVSLGDEIWLRLSDGPDDGDLNNFDEPTIDNLTLTVIPEPSTVALLIAGAVMAVVVAIRRRRS